ncbi:cytohesin-2-like [Dysidea avara]|uniref:cytohesin-2-like n=1 Tax=Dysidea avara TaxID=196820 RepID=UPI00332D4F09
MAEMLWLPSRMLQQCPVSEEIDTPLHAYAVCPTILTPEEQAETEIALRPKYLKVVDQSDIQQIVRFREQVEDEIEELKDQIRRMGKTCNRRQEYEQLIEQTEKKIPTEELWRTGRMRFGNRPSEGINFLIQHGLLNRAPEDVAVFLYEGADILNKVSIGEYFGSAKEFNQSVLKCFVQLLQFELMDLVNALRAYLNSFVLPGESQQIDRMMEIFAARYCSCNPGIFSCADTCYVLSFSVIILNTGLHNPNV